MSVQAALGSLIGASATYAGEHINSKNKKLGTVLDNLGGASSKLATAYGATAYGISKAKTDLAVWDPSNNTGLPSLWDINESSSSLDKTGDMLADNAKKEFDKMGKKGLPVLKIGNEFIEGFDEQDLTQKLLSYGLISKVTTQK